MDNQSLRYSNAAPAVKLFAWSTVPADGGAPVTTLNAGNTNLTSTRGIADTVHPLVTATLGTWISDGFVHRGDGIYDWYCPITVNAAGAVDVAIRASTLPAGVAISPFVVMLTPDDFTQASASVADVDATLIDNFAALPTAAQIAAAVAAPTAAQIATAVDAIQLDNFAALPTAAQIATAVAAPSAAAIAAGVRDELLTVRWGAQTQPVGGSTQILTVTDMPSGTVLGVTRRYRDSGGVVVGQTELTVS
jgi:hypothetical protein